MESKKELIDKIKLKIQEVLKTVEPSESLEMELYNLLIQLRKIKNELNSLRESADYFQTGNNLTIPI
jgi:hypothetical protein